MWVIFSVKVTMIGSSEVSRDLFASKTFLDSHVPKHEVLESHFLLQTDEYFVLSQHHSCLPTQPEM